MFNEEAFKAACERWQDSAHHPLHFCQFIRAIGEAVTPDDGAAKSPPEEKPAPPRPEPQFKVGDWFMDPKIHTWATAIVEPAKWDGKEWRYPCLSMNGYAETWGEECLSNPRGWLPIPARPDQHAARLTGEVRLPKKDEYCVASHGGIVQAENDWCRHLSYGGRRWIANPPEEEPAPATHTCPQAEWYAMFRAGERLANALEKANVGNSVPFVTAWDKATNAARRAMKGDQPCKQ